MGLYNCTSFVTRAWAAGCQAARLAFIGRLAFIILRYAVAFRLSHAASRLPYSSRFRIGFTLGYLSISKWFSGICLTKISATVSA